MTQYRVYPFFITCSKNYALDDPKYNTLVDLAVGKRGIFIKRPIKDMPKKDRIFLVTPSGEFEVPNKYSVEKYTEFKNSWWGEDDEFSQMTTTIKESRKNWAQGTKKKDKIYLFHKYITSLDISMAYKILFSALLTFALLLKLFKPSDIIYKNFNVTRVNEEFLKKETFQNLEFEYDYSIPILQTHETSCTTTE